jgi:hypothetical protein
MTAAELYGLPPGTAVTHRTAAGLLLDKVPPSLMRLVHFPQRDEMKFVVQRNDYNSIYITPQDLNLAVAPSFEATDVVAVQTASGITIGADPEVFVCGRTGRLIPAFKFLPSKADAKIHGEYETARVRTFWDGYQAEMAITDVPACSEVLTGYVRNGLYFILRQARAEHKQAKLTPANVFELTPKQLSAATPEQVALGCAPSSNAYGIPPINSEVAATLPFRFAGAHMHFGWAIPHTEDQLIAGVKAIDAIAGVFSVALFAGHESPIRRQFYGRPGEYRLPKAAAGGSRLEYRAHSSWVLCHPTIWYLMFDLSRAALRMSLNGSFGFCWNASESEVIDCMMNLDQELAHKILGRNRPVLEQIFRRHYGRLIGDLEYSWAPVIDRLLEGVGKVLADPFDMERNWALSSSDLNNHLLHRRVINNRSAIADGQPL